MRPIGNPLSGIWKHLMRPGVKKYPFIAKSWLANWDNLTTFFEFPMEIRKIMYTTNIIENVNRLIRKYTKVKSMLLNDQSVEKVVYLVLMHASKKWTNASKKLASDVNSTY